MEAKLAKCSHCGAKRWNIVGDNDTGYVLTESDGKTCLLREPGTNKAMTAPCDSKDTPYVPLQLQFASASDIKTMSSDGARLIGAASDGDKKGIETLLKDGIDVNVRDWDELTALIPAASSGHLEICKLLVKEGIDVNAKDKDGITALMEARYVKLQLVLFPRYSRKGTSREIKSQTFLFASLLNVCVFNIFTSLVLWATKRLSNFFLRMEPM